MHDTTARMGRFLTQGEFAIGLPVERHALAGEIGDARRALGGDETGNRFIDRARAGGNRVRGMQLGCIGRAHRGGDATLRPSRGRALAERSGRDDGYRHRCELQGGKEPGQPRADNNDVALGAERLVSRGPKDGVASVLEVVSHLHSPVGGM